MEQALTVILVCHQMMMKTIITFEVIQNQLLSSMKQGKNGNTTCMALKISMQFAMKQMMSIHLEFIIGTSSMTHVEKVKKL